MVFLITCSLEMLWQRICQSYHAILVHYSVSEDSHSRTAIAYNYGSHRGSLFCTGIKFDRQDLSLFLCFCESNSVSVEKSEPPWLPYITVGSHHTVELLLPITTEATEAHFSAQESSSTDRIWVCFSVSVSRTQFLWKKVSLRGFRI